MQNKQKKVLGRRQNLQFNFSWLTLFWSVPMLMPQLKLFYKQESRVGKNHTTGKDTEQAR